MASQIGQIQEQSRTTTTRRTAGGGRQPRDMGTTTGSGRSARRGGGARAGGTIAAMTNAIRSNNLGNVSVIGHTYLGRDANGTAIYRVIIRDRFGNTRHQTLTWNGSNFGTPSFKAGATGGITQPGAGIAGGPGDDPRLRTITDKWATWISNAASNGTISASEATSFMRIINNWQGDSFGLDKQMQLIANNVPVGAAAELFWEPDTSGLFDVGGFGGGGGGGFAGPVYVAPDRRVVMDFVKGTLVSLVGTVPEEHVERLTDLYMTEHRRNFDTLDKEIDPAQSVLEEVRKTPEYKSIHKLRPESEDERNWIAQRRAAAEQGGLDVEQQEDFAIEQATVGGDADDVVEAAAKEQLTTSGTAHGTPLEMRFRELASSIFAQVYV